MHNLLGNIRYALRQFRRTPIFTASIILTLALGIGGTTAIFTLIHAVMLRSLPVADPASLYRVGDGDNCCVQSGPQERWGMYSFPLYERLKAAAPEFEEVAAFQAGGARISAQRLGAEPTARPLRSEYVTGTYFEVLGIGPFGGRVFSPDDDTASSAPVAVLSHHAWQLYYGSDPSVVGATFALEGQPFTIIGVAPPGFFGETLKADPPDIWIPLHQEILIAGKSAFLYQAPPAWLRMIGRLRPGASVAGMGPRLTGVLQQWIRSDAQYPANWMPDILRGLSKQHIEIVPAGAGVTVMKEDYGRNLDLLLGVCALVLLIACANVANLLLARAVALRSQTAVRLAIGASRREIIWQALTESVVLAIGGGIAGLAVSMAAARLLLSLAFSGSHFLPISVMPSLPILGFAFGVSLLTGVIFGAAPAWFATRTDPAEALRGVGRSTQESSSLARKVLLIVQATISIVLVAGATMLARSLNNLQGQDLGYPTAGRVLVALHNPQATRTVPQLIAVYRQLEERLNSLPGIRGAGLALYNPLTDNWGEGIIIQGHPEPPAGTDTGASWDRVSANYLQTLGMPILRGRYFTEADNENSANVAIVNQAFVKLFFKPGEDPLDQHFGLNEPQNAGTFRIIGVIRDAKFASWAIREPAMPMFFVPLAQSVNYPDALMATVDLRTHYIASILLQTNLPPGSLEPLLVRTVADLDPEMTVINLRTLGDQVSMTFDQERAVASLAGLFGIVALALAAVGLYGVTAYSVAQRTNEIGIRMALGASRTSVMQLVLRGAFQRVLLGLLIGLPLAIGAGHLIASELYGVSSWDPFALGLAAVSLGIAAFFAAIIPANRAASISPVLALRSE
jgi:predicted permease